LLLTLLDDVHTVTDPAVRPIRARLLTSAAPTCVTSTVMLDDPVTPELPLATLLSSTAP
jgi:hypothetical protein